MKTVQSNINMKLYMAKINNKASVQGKTNKWFYAGDDDNKISDHSLN